MAQCSLLELNETREESERESFLLKIFLRQSPRKSSFHQWKIVTTIKVYGKIPSNSFSGNYTPCARRAKQVFAYCTCLRLHDCQGVFRSLLL